MVQLRNLPAEESIKFSKRGIIKQIEERLAMEDQSKTWQMSLDSQDIRMFTQQSEQFLETKV